MTPKFLRTPYYNNYFVGQSLHVFEMEKSTQCYISRQLSGVMPDVLIQMILKYACSCQMRNSSLHYKNCCLYDGHIDDVFCSLYQTMRNSYWNNLTCKFRNAAYRLTMLGIVDFTEFFFHYGPACDEINAKMRLSYIIETGC